MLEIRLQCEHCRKSLPNDSDQAMICSYECTFCIDCVQTVLLNVCPNCGGGFEKRPSRPQSHLSTYPPRQDVISKPVVFNKYLEQNKNVPPRKR